MLKAAVIALFVSAVATLVAPVRVQAQEEKPS